MGAATSSAHPSCGLSTPLSSKHKHKAKMGQTLSAEDLLSVREKKKRRTGLSTFKKKIVGRRKNLRSVDHAKHFKECFSSKPVSLLSSLLEHYEVLLAMRDLKIQADLARPPAPTLHQNLEDLFIHTHSPDFKLIYVGTTFHVHKSILLARCPYFKDLLLAAGSLATELTVRLATPGVDVSMFSSLLRFLYTGEYPSQEMSSNQIDLLISLGRECGVPNMLEADLEHLYQSGEHTDCILVFTGDKSNKTPETDPDPDSAVQVSCHKAILCARSPFFRNLVSRRLQAAAAEKADQRGPTLPQPMRIVLDESVIPQKYSRVLVRALYVDTIDFDLVDDRSVEIGDRVRDAMELYQIARFLELENLAQNCDDAIVHRLNQTNIVEVLDWSGQPYGSAWVHRQAMQYLLEDFVHVTASASLEKLNKDTLRTLISSDFIQASESEILGTVIRWGELVVARRGEGEGLTLPVPGGRRSGRRRDGLCDREVAEVVCDLVGCVRLENMLGGTEVVKQAAERGLLSRPWYMGGVGGMMVGGVPEPWDPRGYRPPHHRPRLFLPYYEECKALFSERNGSLSSDTSSFNFHRISEIPDTLYMVRSAEERLGVAGRGADPPPPAELPDQDNVSVMVRRVRKLYRSISVQRALVSPFANRQQIFLQLQLRVVREYNLPDSFSAVLQRAMEGGAGGGAPDTPDEDLPGYRGGGGEWEGSRRRHTSLHYLPNPTQQDQPLSDMMPDIALASSSFGSLSLSRSVPSPRGSDSRRSPRPPSLGPDCGKQSPDVVEGASAAARYTDSIAGSRYSESGARLSDTSSGMNRLSDTLNRFSDSISRISGGGEGDGIRGAYRFTTGDKSSRGEGGASSSRSYSPRNPGSGSTSGSGTSGGGERMTHSYRHGPAHMFL